MREIMAFLICVLVWGSTWYGIEFQLGIVAPSWSVAYRFALAALILMAYCLIKGEKLVFQRRDHLTALGLGAFLFSLNYIMVYYGAVYLTSGLVAVAFSLLGLFNILNGRLFLNLKIDPLVLVSALIGVVGLGFIFHHEIETFTLADDTLLGIIFTVGASFIASIGNTVAATPRARSLPLLPFNAWGMVYGTLINIAFATISGDPIAFDPRPSYWIAMAYLALIGTVLAFTLYLWLINRVGVALAGYMVVLTPLVALVVSTIFEGYIWTASALFGVSLVIGGNVMMARRRQAIGAKK